MGEHSWDALVVGAGLGGLTASGSGRSAPPSKPRNAGRGIAEVFRADRQLGEVA